MKFLRYLKTIFGEPPEQINTNSEKKKNYYLKNLKSYFWITIFARGQDFGSTWLEISKKSWKIMKNHEKSWKIMKNHEKSDGGRAQRTRESAGERGRARESTGEFSRELNTRLRVRTHHLNCPFALARALTLIKIKWRRKKKWGAFFCWFFKNNFCNFWPIRPQKYEKLFNVCFVCF